MVTGVCAQTSSTATETVAFWSVFPSVAVFAVQLFVVLGAIGGVQKLATHFCESRSCLCAQGVRKKKFVRIKKLHVFCEDGVTRIELTALEAHFVPFVSAGDPLFGGVHGLNAFRAFWVFDCDERHF